MSQIPRQSSQKKWLRTFGATLLVFAVASCSSSPTGSGGGGGGGGDTPSISITLSGASLTLTQGENGVITVNLTRSGGFAGSVTLAAEGLPSGVSATAGTIASGATTGTVEIEASPTATTGTFTATIRASGAGVTAVTGTLTLTVNESVGETPSISITLSSAAFSLAQGEEGQITVTVTRAGGFEGEVTLAAEGLPAGATATADPIAEGASTGDVLIQASPTATPGTSTVTIRAAGTEVTDATATFDLTVVPTGVPESISITLSTTALELTQGESGQITVDLTRSGGFEGEVTLAVEGLPAGATAIAEPIAAGAVTGDVEIELSPTTTPGTSTVTIRASSFFVADATATFDLTVNQSGGGGGGGNTSYSFCADDDLPVFFAYKDGDAAWMAVQPDGVTYSFDLTAGHGGVAWVTNSGGPADVQVFLGSSQELGIMGGGDCMASGGKTVHGTVAGLNLGDQATISLGSSSTFVFAPTSNFTLQNVSEGIVDLIASASSFTINGEDVTVSLDKMIIRRDLNPMDGGQLAVLDFGSAEAFDPVLRNLTINNLNGDMGIGTALFFTSNLGAAGTFFTDFQPSTDEMRTFPAVPEEKFQAGDLQLVGVTALPDLDSQEVRIAMTMSGTPSDQTVTLGDPLAGVDLTVPATAPYVRPRIEYGIQSDYDDIWFGSFAQTTGNSLIFTVTSGYVDGAGTLDVTAPDFSGLAGWNNAWGLQPGQETHWTFTGTGWDGGQGLFSAPFADGVDWRTGSTSDQFTP